jgi:hypothetical protein
MAKSAGAAYDLLAMTSKVLTEIMTSQGGCQRDGARLIVPADVEATVYVTIVTGAEALVLDRVIWMEVGAEMAVIGTSRKERYVLPVEQIAAVRFSARGGGAGYA